MASMFSSKSLTEAIKHAYSICESYADVVHQHNFNAFDRAQQFAANMNPAMGKIYRSQKQLEGLYSEIDESDDKIPTSFISQANPVKKEIEPVGDIYEDSLGLTARELGFSELPKHEIPKQKTNKKEKITINLSNF